MLSKPQGSLLVWKFSDLGVATALIAAGLEAMEINIATATPPPNFQTQGKFCRMDDSPVDHGLSSTALNYSKKVLIISCKAASVAIVYYCSKSPAGEECKQQHISTDTPLECSSCSFYNSNRWHYNLYWYVSSQFKPGHVCSLPPE